MHDPVEDLYRSTRRSHWEHVATSRARRRNVGGAYHERLESIYASHVAPGQRVLEIGSGDGDLLAAVRPTFGVGVDFSSSMICRARCRHPNLMFVQADAHALPFSQPFDVIILSDLINDLWDVERALGQIRHAAGPHTRLILNFYSRLWELPLLGAQSFQLATRGLPQNWLTLQDVYTLIALAGLEPVREWTEILLPLNVPVLARIANVYLARFWPLSWCALTHIVTARTVEQDISVQPRPAVSVIVPARNEAGNIAGIFHRTPAMGSGTELIFVEGHSTDDTYGAIQREIAANPNRDTQLLKQQGRGKGDAVRQGFAEARGDLLMILDADLTVAPEDLPRFYNALVSGKGEFINGVRLVYPMEKEAMRLLNLFGNKFFSLLFTWLIGQPITDTLCGTKVLWKEDYIRIAKNRQYFGDFDPFGDFDLLFGASKLGLKIVDLPIRYRERTYGETNIQRWKHGLLLVRMVLIAARRLKFV